MFWKTVILLLPCLVSAYLPPKKPADQQPVKTPPAGVSGSYGSIVGVQGSEINYGLVNSNLPAPAMNYGSIKQQPAAPAPVEAPVSEGAAAYGSIKEASSAAPPPPTPKPSEVPVPPVPQSYDAYASAGEQQSAVNPAQPPPPSSYGSINAAAEVAYGQATPQTAATPTPAPEPQTQAPPVAGYGAPPVQPAYGAAAAQPQQTPPSGYAALPPTSAQQKPVESETAAGSGTYEAREIPKPQAAPVAPGGQYGGYMSLSMWKSKSKDDTVPKEQQTETETDAANSDAGAEGAEEEQTDEEVTPQTPEEEQATKQDAEQTEVDDQVEENKVVTAAPAPAPAPKACVDKNDYCDYWKTTGECEKNPAYMNVNCPKACGVCKA